MSDSDSEVEAGVVFPTPDRELSPEIDHTRNYTNDERLHLALASYYGKMETYNARNEGKKPQAASIARQYGVAERTMQRHVSHPTTKTRH